MLNAGLNSQHGKQGLFVKCFICHIVKDILIINRENSQQCVYAGVFTDHARRGVADNLRSHDLLQPPIRQSGPTFHSHR